VAHLHNYCILSHLASSIIIMEVNVSMAATHTKSAV